MSEGNEMFEDRPPEPTTMDEPATREFWRGWVWDNPEVSPLVTTLLRRWETLAPPGEPQPIAWEDAAMEFPDDPDQQREALGRLEAALTERLNLAALSALVAITTVGEGSEAIDLSTQELEAGIGSVEDPWARIALVEGLPVDRWTQIGWLVSWWIQDPAPAGLPTPPWVTSSDWAWTAPTWDDPSAPPKPAWIQDWMQELATRTGARR